MVTWLQCSRRPTTLGNVQSIAVLMGNAHYLTREKGCFRIRDMFMSSWRGSAHWPAPREMFALQRRQQRPICCSRCCQSLQGRQSSTAWLPAGCQLAQKSSNREMREPSSTFWSEVSATYLLRRQNGGKRLSMSIHTIRAGEVPPCPQ